MIKEKVLSEIKKALYRSKPMATDSSSVFGERHYTAFFQGLTLKFVVPMSEGASFNKQEPAQLLIRWLSEVKFN